ncbi:PEP-CTERM sorting domain-containing protein [Coraliomargarita sp. SDUM461003]|uniref:PEP-CTERM sorting domain-containing protein n=1 Tax=Thalassobacterium maritimum TaxID=3041265 RepID=A0ABU1AXK1_9BACT|nr:PEP-CTERM sorting domain-containing protein [Coraliomargarita sp. SDUM461003]MDQ8208894.1 PEP-CTERM sorting domain-containing protein [Coraliomargarita sp. SDUM461003]
MKATAPLLTLLPLSAILASSAFASTTYNIDFNDTDSSGSSTETWNTYNEHTDLVSGTTLVDSQNNSSSVFITATGDILTSSGNNLSNPATRPAWLPEFAADDFFWTGNDTGNNELSFTTSFGGLTTGNTLSLDLFAARESSLVLEANYEYSLDGGSTWSGFTVLESDGSAATTDGWNSNDTQSQLFNLDENGGYEDGRYLSISNIVLTGSTFDVKVTVPGAANYAGINAMKLTIIPEPGSYALMLGLLALGAQALRRRRV